MKVLQVIDTLNIGGAEKVAVTLTNLLWQKSITTDVLLIRQKGALADTVVPNAQIIVLDRKRKLSLNKLYETHTICKKYDLVHVHMRHCYAYIRLVQLLFNGKYKLILHDHFGDINVNRSVPISLSGIFKPKYYIGVSLSLTSWAKNKLGLNDSAVYLLLNSTNSEYVDRRIVGRTNNILLVSNIRPTKNIEFAVSLIENTDYNLTIYGNKGEGKYYDTIKELANAAGVNIVEGQSDLTGEYTKYDMALHCSKSETGPLVLLEYMAHGLPFLAYKTGAVAEMAAGELPLYFIDNFRQEEWLNRIELIMAKQSHAELKEVFNKHFSPQIFINNCLQIYQRINSL